MSSFVDALVSRTGFPREEVQKLEQISRLREIPRSSYFIRAGEHPTRLAFVASGLFRYVYLDSEGNEFTKAFMPQGSFLSCYSSMISGEPAYFFIEALEDATVYEFDYSDWKQLLVPGSCWKDLLIRMLEMGYSTKERRERELLLLDAKARYLAFRERHPDLEDRVSQRMIASYLGIKPESLSRLRKSLEALT